VITVHNCGAPIPPALQEAIFEPLVRSASAVTSETHGIGLGLFIARAIVASHEGKISVTSSESAGTTMSVRLPRAAGVRPA
jgi:signal transduction histidine kinase